MSGPEAHGGLLEGVEFGHAQHHFFDVLVFFGDSFLFSREFVGRIRRRGILVVRGRRVFVV